MTTQSDSTTAVHESTRKQASLTTTSKDGRWRTFLKHAGLMQFIPSGTYYARCKVQGKSIRASLETDVFTTAKLKLPNKIKKLKRRQPSAHSRMAG